jgi:hypothetical protein
VKTNLKGGKVIQILANNRVHTDQSGSKRHNEVLNLVHALLEQVMNMSQELHDIRKDLSQKLHDTRKDLSQMQIT